MAQTTSIPGFDGVRHISGPDIDGPAGKALWARADRAMPSGAMFMTRSARFAGYGVQPGFIAESQGCRVRDVDGRSYIDLNCGNGPNLLGYRHPEVESAARAQADKGDLMPYFPPVMIDFCERLLAWAQGFDWSLPVKAGSDATALATRIARASMQRDNVLLFKHAYHGSNSEQSLHHEGAPRDALAKLHRLGWNDAEALDAFPAAEGEKVAAIMINPIDQNPGVPAAEASPEFIAAIHRFRDRTGALIICDDVRSGFRIHPQGSHKAMGLEPDMICLGKALGNGHAVGAIIGREPLREAASRILYTSTYVFSAVCMAASIATLDVYERDHAFDAIMRAGERLRDGVLAAAARHGAPLGFSGPVSHPTVVFADDRGNARSERFAYEAAKRGLLFHPRLCWFLSSAHDDAAIDEAIAIADAALKASA
jgi:glutamate-1-semialdehyde 2,1-aminomutase